MSTANLVRGLERFVGSRFELSKAYRWLQEVWRMRFGHRKACRFADFCRVVLTAAKSLAGLQKFVRSHKACRRLPELWIVRFDHRNTCSRRAVL